MATIYDSGPKKARKRVKHKVKIKVFVDGKELCLTENVTDHYDGGRCGIGMQPSVLEGKDTDYICKILIKQAECLIKHAEYMTKTGEFAMKSENDKKKYIATEEYKYSHSILPGHKGFIHHVD